MDDNKNVHASHRDRIRERAEWGFHPFAEHELLEMLLFYSIPRGDTNVLGHELIEHFGSFNAVLEASVDELTAVKGIGKTSALQIKLVAEMIRRYVGGFAEKVPRYDTVKKVAEYIWPRFLGLSNEQLYMMIFNNKMAMIDCLRLAEGSVNSASVPIRMVAELSLKKNASAIILAHNHPHGVATPSDNDLQMTHTLADSLAAIDVPLIEHLIIAEDRFMPIVKTHCSLPKVRSASNCSLFGANGFDADSFYDVDEETYRFSKYFDAVEKNLGPI